LGEAFGLGRKQTKCRGDLVILGRDSRELHETFPDLYRIGAMAFDGVQFRDIYEMKTICWDKVDGMDRQRLTVGLWLVAGVVARVVAGRAGVAQLAPPPPTSQDATATPNLVTPVRPPPVSPVLP